MVRIEFFDLGSQLPGTLPEDRNSLVAVCEDTLPEDSPRGRSLPMPQREKR